jgi:hypothetical protein
MAGTNVDREGKWQVQLLTEQKNWIILVLTSGIEIGK